MPSTNPDMAHVEALEAENRRLREALKRLVSFLESTGFSTRFLDEARAALKGEQS